MAKQSVKKPSPDKTKDLLLEAAGYLFARHGYAGTSVKDISDRAGVNVSLVSYHFGGKEGLYRACLEPFVEEKLKFFERNILRPTSAADFRLRLKLFVEEIVVSEFEQRDMGCIVGRDAEMDDPIVMDIFKKTVLKLFDQFISFLRAGQQSGYLRKDLEAANIAHLFMGSIQHALRTDHLRKKLFGISLQDEKHRQVFIETSIEMFFNGFKPQT